MYSQV